MCNDVAFIIVPLESWGGHLWETLGLNFLRSYMGYYTVLGLGFRGLVMSFVPFPAPPICGNGRALLCTLAIMLVIVLLQ